MTSGEPGAHHGQRTGLGPGRRQGLTSVSPMPSSLLSTCCPPCRGSHSRDPTWAQRIGAPSILNIAESSLHGGEGWLSSLSSSATSRWLGLGTLSSLWSVYRGRSSLGGGEAHCYPGMRGQCLIQEASIRELVVQVMFPNPLTKDACDFGFPLPDPRVLFLS